MMKKRELIFRYIKNPLRIIRFLGARSVFNWLPDKQYLKLVYWSELGHNLNLKAPVTFNEKLQWLKLYDRRSEYVNFVDKFAVRSYVKDTIGEKYLIPLLGVYNNVEEIDWDSLPNSFVLKCTHGSHCHIICTDKDNFNYFVAKKKLKQWLKKSWYWFGREWPYKNVTGRIICEQFLGDLAKVPNDYKIMCFNGEPEVIQIHKKSFDGHHTIDFYDLNGNLLPFRKVGFTNSGISQIDVGALEEMLNLARKLSKGKPYLRTDFYLVNGEIYFGELTLFDSSGFIDFEPEESNIFLGNKIKIHGEGL